MVSVGSFYAYVMTGHDLTIGKAFTVRLFIDLGNITIVLISFDAVKALALFNMVK